MRTYDEAFAAARNGRPFSNGTEGYAWMDSWCDRCFHDKGTRDGTDESGCPLVMVALMEKTPSEWLEQDSSNGYSLGDTYHCIEFRDEDEPGPGYEPEPDPPMPGQLELFDGEPFVGTRMFVQPQDAEVTS